MSLARFFSFPGVFVSAPRCGVTLVGEGPMKPRRDDENRARAFASLGIDPRALVSLSQIHSRVVRVAETRGDMRHYPEGDGILTVNTELVPCVTVADCMPVYLFDPVSGCFGMLHSGWKGTGIVRDALALARDRWDARARDFRVILGPHIRSCCYTVDRDRAEYFTHAFGPSCVAEDRDRIASGDAWPYRLSLAEANRLLCLELGIPPGQILDTGECTACSAQYGSSRREGADRFTHMAAFISWN